LNLVKSLFGGPEHDRNEAGRAAFKEVWKWAAGSPMMQVRVRAKIEWNNLVTSPLPD
jgi:hypothetical protein